MNLHPPGLSDQPDLTQMAIWVQPVKLDPFYSIRRTILDLLHQPEPPVQPAILVTLVQLEIPETQVELDPLAYLEELGQVGILERRVLPETPGTQVGLDQLDRLDLLAQLDPPGQLGRLVQRVYLVIPDERVQREPRVQRAQQVQRVQLVEQVQRVQRAQRVSNLPNLYSHMGGRGQIQYFTMNLHPPGLSDQPDLKQMAIWVQPVKLDPFYPIR